MMKKLFLSMLAIGTLVFTSCEKDEINALNDDLIALASQSAAADAALNAKVDAAIVEFAQTLLAAQEAQAAVDAAQNEELASALAGIDAAIAGINSGLIKLAEADAAIIESLNSSVAELTDAIDDVEDDAADALSAAIESQDQALASAIEDLEGAISSGDASTLASALSSIDSAVAGINETTNSIEEAQAALASGLTAVELILSDESEAAAALIAEVGDPTEANYEDGDCGFHALYLDQVAIIDSKIAQGGSASLIALSVQLREEWDALHDSVYASEVILVNEADNGGRDVNGDGDQNDDVYITIAPDFDNCGTDEALYQWTGEYSLANIATTQDVLDSINALRAELAQTISEGDAAAIQTAADALETAVENLNTEIAANTEAIADNSEAIAALETDIDRLDTAIAAIDFIDATELSTAIEGLRSDLETYSDNSDATIQTELDLLDNVVADLGVLEATVSTLSATGSDTTSLLEDIQTALAGYATSNDLLELGNALTILIDANTASIDGVVAGLENTISGLNVQIGNLNVTIDGLNADLTAAETQAGIDATTISGLQSDLATSQASADALQVLLDAELASGIADDATIADLQSQITTLESTIADKDAEISGYISDIANLNSQIDGLTADVAAGVASLATLQTSYDELVAAGTVSQTALDAANAELVAAQGTITDLQGQIATLEANQEDGITQSDVDAVQADLNTALADLAAANTEIARLEGVIADLMAQIAALEANDPADTASLSDWSISDADWSALATNGGNNGGATATYEVERTRTCDVVVEGVADAVAPTCDGDLRDTQVIADNDYVEPNASPGDLAIGALPRTVGDGIDLTVEAEATDADGDTLTYTWESRVDGGNAHSGHPAGSILNLGPVTNPDWANGGLEVRFSVSDGVNPAVVSNWFSPSISEADEADGITFLGDWTIDESTRVAGIVDGTHFRWNGINYQSLQAAKDAAEASLGSNVAYTVQEFNQYSDDTFTERQTYTVNVNGEADSPAPVPAASDLEREGSSANEDVLVQSHNETTPEGVVVTGTVTIEFSGTTGDSLLGVDYEVDGTTLAGTTFAATAGVEYSVVVVRQGTNVDVSVTFSEADLSDGVAVLELSASTPTEFNITD